MLWTLSTILLASDTPTDTISGGAGWVGAGLLGVVLWWLLFIHLPNKDKQMISLMESKDKSIKEVTDAHGKALEQVISTFRSEIKDERSSCQENFRAISESIKTICKGKQS